MSSGALDHVQLHLVTSMADVAKCWEWAFSRREGPLSFDTESAGLSPYHHPCRLIQIGDLNHGWAFPADQWAGPALEILSSYPGELLAHNSPYDNRVLGQNFGWRPRWERTHDSLIGGHLDDSVKLAGLKPRAAMDIDRRAIRGEQIMKEGMRRQHWTWATVPATFEPYWTYGALDPVSAAHLWRKFSPAVTGKYQQAYDLERATLRICADMMDAGMMVDLPYIERNIAERERYYEQAMGWLRRNHGIETVNSNEQVGAALNRAGIPTLAWTDGGKAGYRQGGPGPVHQHLPRARAADRHDQDLPQDRCRDQPVPAQVPGAAGQRHHALLDLDLPGTHLAHVGHRPADADLRPG